MWKGACRCAFTPPDSTHLAWVWKPFILRNTAWGTGEVAQQFRALILAEDPGPTRWFTSICNSSFKGSCALFSGQYRSQAHTHTQHTYLQAGKALTHIEINRASWESNAVCQHRCIVLYTDSRDTADYKGTKA